MKLSLHTNGLEGTTTISNRFIDEYMPQANGEFVKIYLYLYRCLAGGAQEWNLTFLADIFSCNESDILRALRYWESRKLIALSKETNQMNQGNPTNQTNPIDQAEQISITFLELPRTGDASLHSPAAEKNREESVFSKSQRSDTLSQHRSEENQAYKNPDVRNQDYRNPDYNHQDYKNQDYRNQDCKDQDYRSQDYKNQDYKSQDYKNQDYKNQDYNNQEHTKQERTNTDVRLSADRIRELKENEEVRQMLFIAEQYLGTTLSRTVTDELLYIYEGLHFSVDLIDYLIEYCVSKGSGDIHYIKKVAQRWHQAGITTAAMAKQETSTYHRNYFSILKAFGITNRNPVSSEIAMIDHWMKDYGFSLDIMEEACTRTVIQTGKANFKYADKILSGWKERGVRHQSDIQALDALHRQLQADRKEEKSASKAASKPASRSRFHNFKQRDYDYNELEQQLEQHLEQQMLNQ